MTHPFTTYPAPAQSGLKTPDPADLWDYLVSKGLSGGDATRHVLRVLQNAPANVQREYLKDVDPGALASFGLGAADMMSFGLGDQFARKLEGQEAVDTQQAAKANHPTAHVGGEIAGLIGPAGVEHVLAKAGVIVPGAVGRLVAKIASKPARAVAKTAMNAAAGAAYAGAQAAGHTEGGLAPRLQAAEHAAPAGAVLGGALPWLIGGAVAGKRFAGKLAGPVADFVAGESPALAPKAVPSSHFAGGVLDDIAQAAADKAAGRLSPQDFNTAMEVAGRQMRGEPAPSGLLGPRLTPIPGQAQGLLGPEGISPPPKAAYPPSLSEMQGYNTAPGRPGHPVWRGEAAPTRSVRTEPLTPSVEPTDPMRALLRKQSASKLRATLAKPETPSAVRQLIQVELKRRRA